MEIGPEVNSEAILLKKLKTARREANLFKNKCHRLQEEIMDLDASLNLHREVNKRQYEKIHLLEINIKDFEKSNELVWQSYNMYVSNSEAMKNEIKRLTTIKNNLAKDCSCFINEAYNDNVMIDELREKIETLEKKLKEYETKENKN